MLAPANGHASAIAELYAMAIRGGRGGSQARGAFVFRPGGVAASNVYTSWAALYAARSAIVGPVTIQIDDSIVSPAVIPAGSYAMGGTTFVSIANFNNANGGAVLQLADGCVFTGMGVLVIGEWLLVQSMSAATPVIQVAAADECNVVIGSFGALEAAGAAPVFRVQSGGFLWLDLTSCAVGDGTHAVVSVDAGGAGQVNARESSLRANLFTGAGAAGFDLFIDSGTLVGAPTGGPTATLSDDASLTFYTAASGPNWSNSPPATVAAALDRIAAKIGPIS